MTSIFRPISFNFGAAAGITQTLTRTVELGNVVVAFEPFALLQGFDVSFSNMNDHNLGRFLIQISSTRPTPTSVRVTVSYLLRDWSGEIDDPYEGTINVIVFGEVSGGVA